MTLTMSPPLSTSVTPLLDASRPVTVPPTVNVFVAHVMATVVTLPLPTVPEPAGSCTSARRGWWGCLHRHRVRLPARHRRREGERAVAGDEGRVAAVVLEDEPVAEEQARDRAADGEGVGGALDGDGGDVGAVDRAGAGADDARLPGLVGCVLTVTVYIVPLASGVAKVNVPFAVTVWPSPPLSSGPRGAGGEPSHRAADGERRRGAGDGDARDVRGADGAGALATVHVCATPVGWVRTVTA